MVFARPDGEPVPSRGSHARTQLRHCRRLCPIVRRLSGRVAPSRQRVERDLSAAHRAGGRARPVHRRVLGRRCRSGERGDRAGSQPRRHDAAHLHERHQGLRRAAADWGGRADDVYDALGVTGEDCNGHGTHVAGTIGAATYGVAKAVSLHGVRVLNCAGIGLNSDVIAGVDWVTANHASPAVANMSLGGGKSAALDQAVTSLWNSGVFLAVAAGNDNADACNASPAGASGVFTVAASEKTDAKASYSNWGTCVEAYGPGSAIKSTYLAGLTMTLSGTSMATPHVTGVAALYKAANGDQPSATVSNWLITNATAGVIPGNPSGTPNRLLFKSTL